MRHEREHYTKKNQRRRRRMRLQPAATVGYVASSNNGKRTTRKIKIEHSCSNDDKRLMKKADPLETGTK